MAAPDPSRLDANQVLQGSFDESTGRLRTDSLATVVNADIDVALDATEDNVAIASPDGDFLAIETDGSINVNSVDGALEATQLQVLAELVASNSSLDAIEVDTDLIRIAVQSIDTDFDVALSTRATEATQLANNTELQDINTELDSQTAQLVAANSSLDAIEADIDLIRIATQSIDTDFDVALSTRATEVTQLANNQELQDINSELNTQTTELIAINSSLDAIEADTDLIRIAVQSIDSDIDVPLSTRATEVTQLANNQELIDLNVRLETNNNLYSRILPVLSNANWMVLGNFDSIQETFLGNTATLSYKEDTFEIGKATVVFNGPTDWSLSLERYIVDDDGSKLLDDDDTELNLD